MGPSLFWKARGFGACVILALLTSTPSFADEPIDQQALAIAVETARDQLRPEFSAYLAPPLSQEQIEKDIGWTGFVYAYLVDAHPGREADALAFINETFVPALLDLRDDLLCRKTRMLYERLAPLNRKWAEAKRDPELASNEMYSDDAFSHVIFGATTIGTTEYDWLYLLYQSWYALEAAQFTPYYMAYGSPVDTTQVFRYEALKDVLENQYALSAPCDAPFASTAAEH